MFVLVRTENLLDWSWTATLWPFWFAFAIIVLMTLFNVLMLFWSLVCCLKGESSWKIVIGNLWVIFLTGGMGFVAFYCALVFLDRKGIY